MRRAARVSLIINKALDFECNYCFRLLFFQQIYYDFEKKKGSQAVLLAAFSRTKRKRRANISDGSLWVPPRPPSLSV